MNIKRFVLAITILIVVAATVLAIAPVRAATVCSPATAITVPYAKDGVGDVCLKATSLCGYINSWNLTTLDVNGTSYLNAYVAASAIAPLNGTYTIHYVGPYSYSHFEIGGTCTTGPTATTGPSSTPTRTPTKTGSAPAPTFTKTITPTTPSPTRTGSAPAPTFTKTATPTTPAPTPTLGISATPKGSCTGIAVPYAKDGIDDVCLQATSLCGDINSWNLTTLTVNGTSYLNAYVDASTIAPLNGGYTIHYVSTVSYGHFEIGGTCTTGPTATTGPTVTAGPSLTPTRTPTSYSGPTPTNTVTAPTVTPTGPTPTPPPYGTHLANPFVGATMYVNHDWQGSSTYAVNTFLWLDSIDAVNGTNGYGHSLAGHLDLALAQGANAVTIVIYDLPNRDCSALASGGELLISGQTPSGTTRYRGEYIDAIYNVISQAKYAGLRIIAVVEPDSLPNLVTNTSFTKCQEATSTTDGYVVNTQYTLNKLSPLSNFYSYIDIGHAGWLGWDSNFTPAVTLISNAILGTNKGATSIDGFISNTANTSVTVETYLDANTNVGGNPVRSSKFYGWNVYIDESHYDAAWKTAMTGKGINSGMLIDTSRNGWGGCGGGQYALQTCRPTATSTSTDLETYVTASRIDRRPAKGDWCNQDGAGLGALPAVNPGNGFDAYVWVKPPAESDGSSSLIPTGPDNPGGKGFDRMCDPTYTGNALNNNSMTNALSNAPISGRWFATQWTQLVANKYP